MTQLLINLLANLLHCGTFSAHNINKLKKNGNKSDIVRDITRKILSIFKATEN